MNWNLDRALNNHLHRLADDDMCSDVVMPCCGATFEGPENYNYSDWFKANGFKPHEIEDDIYHCPCCGMTVYNDFYDEIKTIAV